MEKTKMMYQFNNSKDTHKLYIYDDVTARGKFNWSDWTYAESETSANFFREQLDSIPETDPIELYINSNGGEVKEGIAIYNMLKRSKNSITAYIDGNAYSVASLIAMAADKIIMGLGTSMLVHEMWMYIAGNADELRKAADDLDCLMATNRQVYLARCKDKLDEDSLKELMKQEKYLTPDECLEYGFCDEIADYSNPDPEDTSQKLQLMNQMLLQRINERKELAEALKEMKAIVEPQQQKPNNNDDKKPEKALAFFGALGK